jgi:AcrR family transcriptional regulator
LAEPAPVGLREHAKLEAFERIRSTAVALLAEKSLDDLTTREIAQRAGVGEATLFRYVDSKWALVILAYGDRLDDLLDRIVEADRRTAATVSQPTGEFYCQRVLDAFWMRSEMYMESPENGAIYLKSGFPMAEAVNRPTGTTGRPRRRNNPGGPNGRIPARRVRCRGYCEQLLRHVLLRDAGHGDPEARSGFLSQAA